MAYGQLGARLVAGSVPLYALGVAIALYLAVQTDFTSPSWALLWAGLCALVAMMVVLPGTAGIGVLSRRRALAIELALIAAVAFVTLSILTKNYAVVYLLYFVSWALSVLLLLAYPSLVIAIRARRPDVLSRSMAEAAPLVVAIAAAPIVLGAHYWPESDPERTKTIVGLASAIAVVGAIALATGIPTLRLSARTAGIALIGVTVIEVALFARGLPNAPTALATATSVTVEYPLDKRELAADAPAFSERVALIVRKSAATLPPGGVYVRYRWLHGPDDPPPPSGTAAVTLWLDQIAKGDRRAMFTERAANAIVPEPEPRNGNRYGPWRGFIDWISLPEDADALAELLRKCDTHVKQKSFVPGTYAAPYVRRERLEGIESARALYASSLQTPPTDIKEWVTLVTAGCVYLLSTR